MLEDEERRLREALESVIGGDVTAEGVLVALLASAPVDAWEKAVASRHEAVRVCAITASGHRGEAEIPGVITPLFDPHDDAVMDAFVEVLGQERVWILPSAAVRALFASTRISLRTLACVEASYQPEITSALLGLLEDNLDTAETDEAARDALCTYPPDKVYGALIARIEGAVGVGLRQLCRHSNGVGTHWDIRHRDRPPLRLGRDPIDQ